MSRMASPFFDSNNPVALWIKGYQVASGGDYPSDEVIPIDAETAMREVEDGTNIRKGEEARGS